MGRDEPLDVVRNDFAGDNGATGMPRVFVASSGKRSAALAGFALDVTVGAGAAMSL